MRILLVEDDTKVARFLAEGLVQSGYAVDIAEDGEIAMGFLNTKEHDLVICDIMLPKLDGMTLVETFRKEDPKTPILILSAKRSVEDRVRGLQIGADDYLTKPFSLSELLARVSALFRRSGLSTNPNGIVTSLTAADMEMDLMTREVRRGSTKIELQFKEYSLLEYFLRNQGRVLTKSMILNQIWNYQFNPQTNVVDVLVFRLRNKIDRGFEKKLIQNIRGVGYVFQPN